MRRLVLTAALCLSIGCVKGVCYDYRDCPAPQVCTPSGACVVLPDASAAPTTPLLPDAGDGEEIGGSDDVAADTTPECPPLMVAVGDSCTEPDAP